jgi:hypothetical protein
LLFSVNFGDEVYPFHTWPGSFEEFKVTKDWEGLRTVEASSRPLGSTFNSSNPPELHYAYFSGKYEASFNERRNYRPIYYEQGLDPRGDALGKDVTAGNFYYCEK